MAGSQLCGSTTVSGGTIITIPAGMTWDGTVAISATISITAGGAAVNASARISVVGDGVSPPPGDYLIVDLSAPASVVGAIGTGDSGNNNIPMVVTAGPNAAATLVLNSTNTTRQSASACGSLSIR